MKLYSIPLSPFAARCRMQIRAKNLDVEIVDGHPADPGFKSLNPIGKIPVLDTGAVRIPECQIICEYLEEKFPEPSLYGRTPEATAMIKLICRLADLYVFAALGPLFPQLRAQEKDQDVIAAQTEALEKALGQLEHFVAEGHYAVDGALSLADCALMPVLLFVDWMYKALGQPSVLVKFEKLSGYFEAILKDEHAAATHEEIQEGLAAMMAG